jgi:LacI family transcriptional regulator
MRKVVLLIENSRGFGRALLQGIAKYSRLNGPWTFYRMPAFYRDPNSRICEKELHRMEKWGASGIIMREVKNNDELIGLGLPTIVSTYINRTVPNACEIYVNNKGVGEMAADYLLELGFTKFAFCGYDDFFWSIERSQGFTERVRRAGFEPIIYRQPKSRISRLWDNEQDILAAWLKSLPKPVGLMACIDERSQDILEACKIAGLHVPEEIALIGGDNDELICDLANPPLSSVAISGVAAGYQAAELLDRLMDGKEKIAGQQIIVEPTHIHTRQSTDVLAVEDRDVAMAIRFIRSNAREPIQVSDVVSATGLGRRVLEKRFRKVLGRSILNEITHYRIELASRLLMETSMPISQIASTFGYPSVKNIARYFYKEKRTSPLKYRKLYGIR